MRTLFTFYANYMHSNTIAALMAWGLLIWESLVFNISTYYLSIYHRCIWEIVDDNDYFLADCVFCQYLHRFCNLIKKKTLQKTFDPSYIVIYFKDISLNHHLGFDFFQNWGPGFLLKMMSSDEKIDYLFSEEQ